MKTKPTSLLSIAVVIAMLATHSNAQESEKKQETESSSEVTIEINGKKVEGEGSGGTITIRTDGEDIEIDTDGDGKAEEHIKRERPEASGIAWLGVKTRELSPELAAHIGLDGGAVVEIVVPGSPADESGVLDHDVITAIGETKVSTPEELALAIRALNPGANIGVSIVRKAEPTELTAKLGNRPQMPNRETPGLHDLQFGNDDDFNDIRKRIEKIQQEMLNGMPLPNMPDLNKGGDIVRMSSKTTCFSDGDGSISITTKDGVTQIEARDAAGKLLYEGPAETDDDRKKLPPEVLKKLERFEAMDLDMDIRKFEGKRLPPALDPPKLKPAKPKKPTATKRKKPAAA